MRRLLRILLNAATVLSLVLCLAVGCLWVSTFEKRFDWDWSYQRGPLVHERHFCANRGNLLLVFRNAHAQAPCTGCSLQWQGRVLAVQRYDYPPGHQWSVYVHAGALVIAFAALPAGRALAKTRRDRGTHGTHCAACGYDCRATPERCPECGSAVVTTAATPAREGKGETEGV